mmetsp:Transcript_10838/g.28914  ORF Transcript_10838/g.28914 Transcript_10838/m.28914 type:complete len:371 (-) Transcript_10838:137-1249(-)
MPPFPPSMRKELSEEGRQLLLDVMDPAASALSQAAPTRGADPHITIVVVDERFGNRLASLRYDRDSNTAYPPTLDEVVHDLTRLQGVPPDLVMLRSRGIGGRQLEPRGFGELLHAASASGAEALTLELSEDPSAAAGPVRIFSQGSYKAPGRARALVLYDARFATEHNLMTPLLTDVAEDRWAHDALQQVHITSSIVDYYGDGDMIPVLRLTVEFFNPEKLIASGRFVVRPKQWAKRQLLKRALNPAFGEEGWHVEKDGETEAFVLDIEDEGSTRGTPDTSFIEMQPDSPPARVTRLTFTFKAQGVALGLRPLLTWCNRFRLRLLDFRPAPGNYHEGWRTCPSCGHVKFQVDARLAGRLDAWLRAVRLQT